MLNIFSMSLIVCTNLLESICHSISLFLSGLLILVFVCGCLSSLCILEMNSLLLDWQGFCVSHLLHSVDSFAVQTIIYHSSFCLSVLLFPETSAQRVSSQWGAMAYF